MKPGPKNLITDIEGLKVGNASDDTIKTGVTVLIGEGPFVTAVDVMGGSPGTRETDLLAPDKLVEAVDALVLSGGSAFGLDAAGGVTDALAARGRGYVVGDVQIPIVPSAIIFDLINGGDKDWQTNPYRALGVAALDNISTDFDLGTVGAGTGALCARIKGGLGSSSLVLDNGITIGALVVANPTGSVTMGEGPHFWANAFEVGAEFGALGPPLTPIPLAQTAMNKREMVSEIANTTIAIVATDAALTKSQAKRMAVAAQDGIARAVSPAHTPVDGDLVFAVSAGDKQLADPLVDAMHIGHAASICLARAIGRAAFSATPAPNDLLPTWSTLFKD